MNAIVMQKAKNCGHIIQKCVLCVHVCAFANLNFSDVLVKLISIYMVFSLSACMVFFFCSSSLSLLYVKINTPSVLYITHRLSFFHYSLESW